MFPRPSINPGIKTAFRWYHDPKFRARHTQMCHEELKECPFAIDVPQGTVLPFQILAGTGSSYGQSQPTSWKVYDLSGTEVADLTAHISNLQVLQFADPNRDIIMLEGELVLPVAFPTEPLEMEIVTAGGTYYSETFKPICGDPGEMILDNPELSNPAWSLGDYPGRVTGIIRDNGELPVSPAVGSTYLETEGAGFVYTWNGESYDAEDGDPSQFYAAVPTGPFFVVNEGVVSVVPENDWPINSFSGICFNATQHQVPLVFALAGLVSELTVVRLDLLAFWGGVITGQLNVVVDGQTVHTAHSGNMNQTNEIVILVGPTSTITFTPTAGFRGCLQQFQLTPLSATLRCHHRLSWRSCGDFGTVHYKDNDFRNVLYLHRDHNFVGSPTPRMDTDDEERSDGSNEEVFQRKEIDWTMNMDSMPWYLLDVVSDIPMHDDVRLTVAGESSYDTLETITVNHTWQNTCAAKVDIVFTVAGDATVAAECCPAFTPPCISYCVIADGIEGVDTPEVNKVYLRQNAKGYATYLGFDGPPVDEQGFGITSPCASGLARTTSDARPYMFWTGAAWQLAAAIIDIYVNDCEAGDISIVGNVMPLYSVVVQYSNDGSAFTDLPGIYGSSEMGSGVDVEIPDGATHIRLKVVGLAGCLIAYGPSVENPCYEEEEGGE